MILLLVAAIFVVLIVFSMPIVFALGVAGTAGLFIGGYDLQVRLDDAWVGPAAELPREVRVLRTLESAVAELRALVRER